MSVVRDIVVAAIPALIAQIGDETRERLRADRAARCPHGRHGGKLCPHCSPCGALAAEERAR